MNIEKRFDYNTPILVIGWRGFPINGFCYDIIYKGEIHSRLNFSRSDNMHGAYKLAFEDFKTAMKEDNKFYCIEKYTGTLEEFVTRKYFKNPIKRILYDLYLWIGNFF
jgi:hypothetical protein